MEQEQQINCPYDWDAMSNSLKQADNEEEDELCTAPSKPSILPTSDSDWAESVMSPQEPCPEKEDDQSDDDYNEPVEDVRSSLDTLVHVPDHLSIREEVRLIGDIQQLVYVLTNGQKKMDVMTKEGKKILILNDINTPSTKSKVPIRKERALDDAGCIHLARVVQDLGKGIKVNKILGGVSTLTWRSLLIDPDDIDRSKAYTSAASAYKAIIKLSPNYSIIKARYKCPY
ncbi:phosphoprotein [Landjia virus]|uniref:Phosphoprotein n=1 Tax=Landjia virus TaxID=1272947 RepID=A0A0D3R1U1_9RHAB|nr:phosphoprotein [Landjia virus]AJR28482.1 phosphoprotein [Landjia virus]